MEQPLLFKSKSTQEYTEQQLPTLGHSYSGEYFNPTMMAKIAVGWQKFFRTTKQQSEKQKESIEFSKITDLNPAQSRAIIKSHLVDWKTGLLIFDLKCYKGSFSCQDDLIAFYNKDKKIISLSNASTLEHLNEFGCTPIRTVLFPDKKRIIIVPEESGTIYYTQNDATEKKLVPQKLIDSGEIDLADIFNRDSLTHTTFLENNKSIATIYLRDLVGQKIITELNGHENSVTKLQHTQTTIGSGSQDKTVRLWDPELSKKSACLSTLQHPTPITALTFHPKEPYITSGTGIPDGKIYVWDTRKTNQPISITTLESSIAPSALVKNLYETDEVHPSIVYLAHNDNGSSIVAQTKWYDQNTYQTYEGEFLELLAGKPLAKKSFTKAYDSLEKESAL